MAELEKAGPDQAGEATVQYLGRQTAFANQWPDDHTLLDTFVSEPLYWSLTAGRLNLILQGIEGDLRTAWAESQARASRFTHRARHAPGLAKRPLAFANK